MRDETVLHALGARQHAVVTHQQLRGAGFTRHEIAYLVQIARLITMFEGVYRLAGAPTTWRQRLMAACLATGGVASHRSSAWLWDADLPGGEPPIEVTVTRSRCPRPPGVIVHRSGDLTPDQVVRRDGIPTTKPHRLLVDLGAVASAEEVDLVLDSLNSRRLVTIAGVRAWRDRLGGRGRRGAGVLGEVLDQRALGEQTVDSALESMMARLCRRHGLPMPEFQVWITIQGKRFRMDFAYSDIRYNIETDGYEHHGGKYENWLSDSTRDNELGAMGWQVSRFPRAHLRTRQDYVARVIRTIRAERRRLLLPS